MSIDGSDPLITSRHQQFTPDQLLDGKNNTVLTPYSDRGSTAFNSLGSIFYLQTEPSLGVSEKLLAGEIKEPESQFYLEVSSIGTKDGIRKIVACSDRCLSSTFVSQPQHPAMTPQSILKQQYNPF